MRSLITRAVSSAYNYSVERKLCPAYITIHYELKSICSSANRTQCLQGDLPCRRGLIRDVTSARLRKQLHFPENNLHVNRFVHTKCSLALTTCEFTLSTESKGKYRNAFARLKVRVG